MHWKIVAVKHKRIQLGAPSLIWIEYYIFSIHFFAKLYSHHEFLHHLEVTVLCCQVEACVAVLVCLVHINTLDQTLG